MSDPTDPTSTLLVFLAIYLSSFAFFLLIVGASGKYAGEVHRSRIVSHGSQIDHVIHGCFASAAWPMWLQGPISLLITLLGIMPCTVIAICFTFGPLLASMEDWSAKDGILYIIGNMLGLITPLTDNSPESTVGLISGVIVSTWCLLLGNAAMGLVAGLAVVNHWSKAIPRSLCSFLCCIFIFIPLLIVISCGLLGSVMAVVESWPWSDGFYFVVAGVCQLANPLVDNVPETGAGMAVEVVSISMELGFSGAIIGIIGSHPFVRDVIIMIEGHNVNHEFEDLVRQITEIDETHHVDEKHFQKALRFTKALRQHGLLPAHPTAEELQALFSKLDKDGDGCLSLHEVIQSLSEIGVSREDCGGAFDMLDVNKDGKVGKAEFLRLMEVGVRYTAEQMRSFSEMETQKDTYQRKRLSLKDSVTSVGASIVQKVDALTGITSVLPGGVAIPVTARSESESHSENVMDSETFK